VPACVFCGEPASRRGEHVLPQWLLKRWSGAGPFTTELNGKEILPRSGVAYKTDRIPPFLLPVCDQSSPRNCNGALNERYEYLGKPTVRAVLDRGEALDDQNQVIAFAKWWVKTNLLLQHPMCRNDVVGGLQPASDLPSPIYDDVLKGHVTPDVSLWLATYDPVAGKEQLPELMRIYLPTTSNPEGGGGRPATLLVGFSQTGTRLVLLQMVIHPLSDFDHPFEQAGLCIRLWPQPPKRLDIDTISMLNSEGLSQLGSLFVDGRWGNHFPQIGMRTDITAVTDGSPLVFPT